jgi:hypothetical protein
MTDDFTLIPYEARRADLVALRAQLRARPQLDDSAITIAPAPKSDKQMARLRRKRLVVCRQRFRRLQNGMSIARAVGRGDLALQPDGTIGGTIAQTGKSVAVPVAPALLESLRRNAPGAAAPPTAAVSAVLEMFDLWQEGALERGYIDMPTTLDSACIDMFAALFDSCRANCDVHAGHLRLFLAPDQYAEHRLTS